MGDSTRTINYIVTMDTSEVEEKIARCMELAQRFEDQMVALRQQAGHSLGAVESALAPQEEG